MHILIIDDEPKIRKGLERLLSQHERWSVAAFPDAPSALRHLYENEVDAVITDIQMPEVSGLDMDEPTAVLTPQESESLMQFIRDFTAKGNSVIFITHKLKEVMEVANRIVVMFTTNVIGGRGWIAFAICFLGNWSPKGAVFGTLAFGLADAVSIYIQSVGGGTIFPNELIIALPYILTIVLTISRKRFCVPAKLGVPYTKES